MEWVNIHIAKHLRSPEAIGSSPGELGAWLRVLAYCFEQENGGRIAGGGTWKNRQWQQVCAVTISELRAADRLIRFDGDDVVVNGYSVEREAKVINTRKRQQAAAMARWGKRSNASAVGDAMASAVGDAEGEREREVGKGRGIPSPPEADAGACFDEFWDAYDKKTGRKATLAKWSKMKPEDRAAALAGVPAWLAAHPDPKFRKDPVRYLTNEAWNDETPDRPLRFEDCPHAPNSPEWFNWCVSNGFVAP